jgi:hypothetical protein
MLEHPQEDMKNNDIEEPSMSQIINLIKYDVR